MIYVTGDLHGDRSRLAKGPAHKLKKDETLIICGDFGFIWSGSETEKRDLEWIGSRRYRTLFVEGTHDNLDLIEEYPVEDFGGAKAHHICGNLWHLIRGEIYALEGKTFLAMGGGQSTDASQREVGITWWPQELPSESDLPRFRRNLAVRRNKVDYVISHQAPTNIEACLIHRVDDANLLMAFMDEMQQQCEFREWFFGNYHLNKTIPPKHHCVYDAIRPLAMV